MTKSALERVWNHREEVVYPRLFGQKARDGIFVLEYDLFTTIFKQENVDPRWLHYGVHVFGPSSRGTYFYVTSGASNPWEVEPREYKKQQFSGFGTELVFETTESADWPIVILQRLLAFNILLSHGRYGKSGPLDYWHRVPLRAPIVGASALRNIVFAPPRHYEAQFTLESGKVDLLHAAGITDQESDYAREHDSEVLVELLANAGAFPVTDAARASVVS